MISLLHPKDNYSDDSSVRSKEKWKDRPRHVSKVLDSVLSDGVYNRFIDEQKIAVIGYSAGGYTALSLVGAVPDTANIRMHFDDESKFIQKNIMFQSH